MPNIKSAIKRVKIAERNRVRNKAWKSAIRTRRNDVDEAVNAANTKNAQEALCNAYSLIDKAVSKGILHQNTAARRKSRLAEQVQKLAAKKKKKGK